MPSIKRYIEVTKVMGIDVFDSSKIFRAIKVTDDNHRTIEVFTNYVPFRMNNQIAFENRTKENKSRKTVYQIVKTKTPRGSRVCKNGDYIYRTKDGKFFGMDHYEFEAKYKETHIEIKKENQS